MKAILTDIEGTTSSISFVKEVLFPYAYEHLETYLEKNQHKPEIKTLIHEVNQEKPDNILSLSDTAAILRYWIDTDQKKTPLKTLQGYIWQAGYEDGAYQAHLYPDAAALLPLWSEHMPIYIYSSGSIKAQKLFFGHSISGNLNPLFSGYFDTTTGPKKEAASYESIAQTIALAPEEILFLSDCEDEIKAAKASGMQTVHIVRGESHCDQSQARDFYEAQQRFQNHELDI